MLTNIWWLIVPLVGGPLFVVISYREVGNRMADMAGYSRREKAFTILASILPYPFMIRTIWVPFAQHTVQIGVGILLYLIGMGLFFWTLFVFARGSLEVLLEQGPYRISRNPMYAGASIAMGGMCAVSGDPVLIGILVVMIFCQHFMILAEERICDITYGDHYRNYIVKVPRYILF